jgi:hypothetical protein
MMPLHLTLRFSRRLLGLFLILYTGALLCLLFSAAPLWLKVTATLLCLISAWHNIRKYALLSHRKAIVQCTALPDNVWLLKNRSGQEYTACLLGNSWRSRQAILLNFTAQPKKNISVILLPDTVESAVFRRLQVYCTLFS